jgi:hypothetical protein
MDETNGFIAKFDCSLNVARNTQDPKACIGITDQNYLDQCLSVTVTDDISVCNNIKDPKQKDWCYLSVAYNKPDAEICNKISNQNAGNLKRICGVYSSKARDCMTSSDKTLCYSALGLYIHRISICRLIPDDKIREACITEVKKPVIIGL